MLLLIELREGPPMKYPRPHRPPGHRVEDTADDSRVVSLFRNGANQAVRIPREFELPGTMVRLHREGDRLILEPVPAASLHELIRAWQTEPPLDEGIPEFPDEPPEPVSF
jgi:antitoxin VapB